MDNHSYVRVAPATSRNGLPERTNYVYRGCGVDIMPNAITDDTSHDYETGAVGEERGRKTCRKCGYDRRSRKHRLACGQG